MKKRLFFAFNIESLFFKKEPRGKVIKKKFRHITLAFLGDVDVDKNFLKKISKIPKPSFEIAPCGIFKKIIFIPQSVKRVLAYNIKWFENDCIKNYRKQLYTWLKKNNLINQKIKEKKILEHVTICRKPFDKKKWEDHFMKIPLKISKLILYESLGNSKYKNIWNYSFLKPFEEIKHTADIAFIIKGKNFLDLFYNALAALFFKLPKLINYFSFRKISFQKIDDVIISLNDIISKADCDIGIPLKGISFSYKISKEKNIINWEIIIDV